MVWGNGHEQMSDAARRLTRLRWVQTLAAGPDATLAAGFADDVVITSGRGLHDGPVAEHTLALLLARPAASPSWSARRTSTAGPASSAACRTPGRGTSSGRSPARAC